LEKTKVKKVLAVAGVIILVAVALVAFSFFKTPQEASGPIEAIPITADPDQPSATEISNATSEERDFAVEDVETPVEAKPQADTPVEIDAGAEPETQPEPEAAANAANDTEAEAEASSGDDETNRETAAGPIIFEIVAAESQARFLIDEVLRGAPITVVGATDQVAGQLTAIPNDLSVTRIGAIQVNVRTLATDNEFRNRAIKNQILRTNDHEFVTFKPTEVVGLPETGAVGETYTFQIVGELTVTDVTRPVTFDVVATATSDTRIEGSATTAFPYTDFELFIPDAPAVDTVDNVVRLELEFVAEAT
jgi:polyisoprenoid-binding protein YceI